jgi:hypothetical protein
MADEIALHRYLLFIWKQFPSRHLEVKDGANAEMKDIKLSHIQVHGH